MNMRSTDYISKGTAVGGFEEFWGRIGLRIY